MARILPIAVLVSGEGSTLDALAEAAAGGHLPARAVLVLADRPYAPAVERARRRGLPTVVLPFRGVDPTEWARNATALLVEAGAQLIVLAGYLSILPATFVRTWAGRLINLHPSLLPRHGGPGLYGLKVHEAVLAAGEAETGATVHLVTEAVDRGPVLLQVRVPVRPDDTPEVLRERVRPAELSVLEEAIRRFAEGRWPLPYRPSDAVPRPRGEPGPAG